jgi:glyoxylase-like metal-dependent hydrolase (beta-lactamase superfamily II)
MSEEVVPGIFRLPVPLPDSPLATVNSYAFVESDGIRLVDCGWDTPEAHQAMVAQLGDIGGGIGDLREILVTHIHPDHFGLAERLARESGARVLMHRLEAIYVGARYQDVRLLVEQMAAWLRINGVPREELEAMTRGSLEMVRRVGTRSPDVLLQGDEVLPWGRFRLRVLWTPGHSAGLICLHDPDARILLSSDHVLERISPHVGLHTQSLGNPLSDYLDSLAATRPLPVDLVLPGHGRPFGGLPSRVDSLIEHHRQRLSTILDVIATGEQSAYGISSSLPWKGSEAGWDRLAPFERRMAVTEVAAHLEHLHGSQRVTRRNADGVILYRAL